MTRFGYTILYVYDVQKSLEFYESAFGFSRTFITPDQDYGELSTGNTTLSFAVQRLAKSNFSQDYTESNLSNPPFGFEIGIVTDNIEETLTKAVANGAIPIEPIKTKPWGQQIAYVRDLDGFLIEICTPIHQD